MSRSIADPRRRKLVAWRAARVSAVASSAPSWERFSAVRNAFCGTFFWEVPQCTSARSSAHVLPRTRLESRRETRARCSDHSAHPLHIRVRAVGPRGAFPARPSRASAGFPRSRNAPSFFAGGVAVADARIALGRSRGLRHARALRQSLTRSFPPPFRARRHRSNAISEPHLGIAFLHHRNHLNHLNRAPSRGSRTSARARRGFRARSSREASPATRPRQGL